jgi:transcriptional regulator with XRE-family HTH domain
VQASTGDRRDVTEIGQALRSARERQGLERAELERRTHIRTRYLGALEDERFDDIPGRAYAKGFLRVYAEALGLDGPRLIDEFNERYPEVDSAEDERLAPKPVAGARRRRRRSALAAAAVGAAVVVALVTALAWSPGGGHRRPAALSARPAEAKPAQAPLHRTQRAAAKPATAATAHLIVRASSPCWVSVHLGSQTGATLYEGTLAAGGALRYTLAPSRPRIWMRIGAPWAVTMALNGKRAGQLLTAPGNVLATRTGLRTT